MIQNKYFKISRYILFILVIVAGIVLSQLGIGEEFLGFTSVGQWLIFVGFIGLTINILQEIRNKKKKIVDERMELINYKASRITFIALIVGAFIIMIIDGINPIEVPYSLFMSYLLAFLMFIYFIAYKIVERLY